MDVDPMEYVEAKEDQEDAENAERFQADLIRLRLKSWVAFCS